MGNVIFKNFAVLIESFGAFFVTKEIILLAQQKFSKLPAALFSACGVIILTLPVWLFLDHIRPTTAGDCRPKIYRMLVDLLALSGQNMPKFL